MGQGSKMMKEKGQKKKEAKIDTKKGEAEFKTDKNKVKLDISKK
jgi:hypothetical protein